MTGDARSWRNLADLGLVVAGVYFGADVRWAGKPLGFVWAFLDAALFTLYIVLAHRISRSDPDTKPIDRLGAAMLVAAVAITPLGFAGALPALTDVIALGAGIGVGLTSSVFPCCLDRWR